MLQAFFHAWERRLASVTKDRVVRPFEWGLDWIPGNGHAAGAPPVEVIDRYVSQVMADTDAFFTPPPTTDYTLTPAADGDLLTFPSALTTPHESNNTVRCRYFPTAPARRSTGSPRAAVLVMPQWNSDAGGHVGLCKLLAWNGMSALRLSLPYHDQRMPPELHRADYIVSANVMRTLQVCRQAVLDARRAIAWLKAQGYERIGILGTSLGSCLALLTTAHEPLIEAEALNHISPYFADVVWRGLSTAHVREGLDGHDRARSAAVDLAADQPARLSRTPAQPQDAAGLRAIRPDVPGRSVGGPGAGVRGPRHPARSRACCAAATTAPARRRSNSSTDTF